jgi:hypothetical protein
MTVTIPAPCKLIWGIEIFRTRRDTQRWRQTGSRHSGVTSGKGDQRPAFRRNWTGGLMKNPPSPRPGWTRTSPAAHQRESLRDNRQRRFDRRWGFALADVYGILSIAPVTRPSPHRSEIVIGLGLIKIARIKSEAVSGSQFWLIDVSDMSTATRPAFGSLYAWTRHAQVGGRRAARQQNGCGRENKCCDERLGHNRSPPSAPPSTPSSSPN